MGETEKVFTYEEAKELCRKAFRDGAIYGSESSRYHTDAVAYDWNHWLKKNEHLFRPKPTVEDVLREFAEGLGVPVADSYLAVSAAKLQMREDA